MVDFMVSLSRARILAGALLFACIGCHAQSPTAAGNTVTPEQNKRIINLVRSRFGVPAEYTIHVGERKPSDFPGYDTVPVTFQRGEKSSNINFLLSKDGKTLARLDTYDLTRNPTESVSTEGRPAVGSTTAPVTIVNFDDLECPFCARMQEELFPATADRYKGLVRIVYRDYPLVDIHPWAMHAAIDSNCLASQSEVGYWNLVGYLHSHAGEINSAMRPAAPATASGTPPAEKPALQVAAANNALDKATREEGARQKVDAKKLEACMAAQDETLVRASMKAGDALGVDGTPALFINGVRVPAGAQPTDVFWPMIDRALQDAGVTPPPPVTPVQPATPPALN
jgi:protein-disulfide isomerase